MPAEPATAAADAVPPVFPLAPPDATSAWLTPRQIDRAVLAFVALGLLARCVRYFLCFPLWEDECFLCYNLIHRDFRGLLEPLDYHQAAPVLFLWMQLAVVKLLGFHELSLRLVPFLTGLASILLYWRLVVRCLDGLPRLFAIAIFSVTYATIRYSAEAKPYGIDLFVALLLLTCTVHWLGRPGRAGGLWLLAAILAPAVGFSYGAVLLGGGLWVAVGWVVWRQRRHESVLAWIACAAALLVGTSAVYLLSARSQAAAEHEALSEMWQNFFPPLTSAGAFAYWMLQIHTSDLLAYPAGGAPFQSTLSALCWFAALVALARRRQGTVLLLCLTPLAINFALALAHRYPYGGHVRLSLFMAPWMCLLIGYGLAMALAAVSRSGRRPVHGLRIVLVGLALVGIATVLRDLTKPYKNVCDQRARGFAEWFWPNVEFEGEAVCLKTDLGCDFSPISHKELTFSAQFFCNCHIYSPRHARGEPIHWERISATHPLRCVLYRCHYYPFDGDAYQSWLDEMQQRYQLVSRESYPQVRLKNTGRRTGTDYLEILHFVPRPAADHAQAVPSAAHPHGT